MNNAANTVATQAAIISTLKHHRRPMTVSELESYLVSLTGIEIADALVDAEKAGKLTVDDAELVTLG